MINIAVVEDEDAAANALAECIEKYCDKHGVKQEIVRYKSAVELLSGYRPVYDIIFMDIMLPNLNGMDAAKRLRMLDESVALIFVTNMANFAVKGYEVSALDFIVKPVAYASFAMKMRRAVSLIESRVGSDVAVTVDGATKLISSRKIYYAESDKHNVIFHTEDGQVVSRCTMSDIEKRLAADNFVRCNVSYLVNLKYVTEVRGDDVTVGGDVLKISRSRKKEFSEALAKFAGRGA